MLEHYLGGPFGHELEDSIGAANQYRAHLALVVERELGDSDKSRGLLNQIVTSRSARDPEGLVERVAANRTVFGHRRLVADQPQQQRPIGVLPVNVQGSLERDYAFGQGSLLVREQQLDVA